jgi:hypothetical protein
MNLGLRIKLCLDAKNWTQADLVKAVPGLDRANLSALIRRDAKRSGFASQIAIALGCNLEWLVSGTGGQWLEYSSNVELNRLDNGSVAEPEADYHAKLLVMFDELPQSEQQNVLNYIEVRKQACEQLFQDLLKMRGVEVVPTRRSRL